MPSSSSFRENVEQLLRISPQAKPRVYKTVFDAAEVLSLNYGLELILSAGIATLGLVLNSPAVVIGAMLVSPLMGPILAAGLSLAASDLYLGVKSLIGVVLSIIGAIAFSATIVWLLPFHVPTSEILARTQPNVLDLGVAILSGLAGSIVICRGGEGGGVTAMPGVAIAVALMPPLCTVGFGIGAGFDWQIIAGAGLLFLTNLVAITASAFVVFYIVRMDAPDVRASIQEALVGSKQIDWIDRALRRTTLSAALGDIGRMRYRTLLIVAVFVPLFIPLQRSFTQVRDETIARSVAREAVRLIVPASQIVTQVVDVTRDRVILRLNVAAEYQPEDVERAKAMLLRRTGKDVEIDIRRVAGEDDLRLIRETLASRATQSPVDPLADLPRVGADLFMRVEKALSEAWPVNSAPRSNAEVAFDAEGMLIRVRYQSERDLAPPALEAITIALRSKLRNQKTRVEALREVPAAAGRRR
jgi:uncharacterized hydrophobic protein (TIGR00271 family)